MTGKVVNLRQKRKQRVKEAQRQQASQNASLHGRTKAQKHLQKTEGLKAARVLDGHKRDV